MKRQIGKKMWSASASPFISAKQTARLLNVHPISGAGPRYVKAGRAVKYRISEIEKWLEYRTFSHTAEYETENTNF
jgi:hypothetical protein